MNVKILDLTRQYETIQEQVEQAVCEQLRSGMYIGGHAVERFEQKFADYIGVKHAVSVNSGTDALVISLKALGIKEGDEVITTPFTFFATAEAVAVTGAVPVFVDIDEQTFNIDAGKIEEKITKNTKAILPVHIFGQPADLISINEIAHKHNLYVVEDACQAVGAGIGEKKAGAFGDLGCFSFFPTKNLGGFGDGGMITTNDDKTATICRALKEHGAARNGAMARYYLEGAADELADCGAVDGLYNPYKYYNYLIAHNSRLDAVQARVLEIKLDYLEQLNGQRTAIAEFYSHELSGCSEVKVPVVSKNMKSVWHQYAIRCRHKNEMGEYLASKGIGSAAFYPVPLHLQKAFEYLGYKEGDLPVAEEIAKQTVCLPVFPELRQEELAYVAKAVKEFYN